MDVTNGVTLLLVEKFGVTRPSVEQEVALYALGLDSLALEELRLLIEERWQIDLEDVQLTSRETVGQLITAVQSKVPE